MLQGFAPRIFVIWALVWLGAEGTAWGNPTFANAVTNGIVDIAALTEASGIAASRNNPEVLWTHNDSGHPAVVYAIDTQGQLLGTYSLPANTDNEDIAMGPGPAAEVSYLYVGDIGDNGASRANIRVYQIPEPAVYASQSTNPPTYDPKGTRTITLTYPEGPRDAESMFVDPRTGDLFILTKESTSRVYTATKAQLDTQTNLTLTFVRSLSFSVPSAADISPLGSEIIVRRESFAQLWERATGQSISNAFSNTAIEIPVTGTGNGEPNGEAIGFDPIGSGYYTLSDDAGVQPLRYFARTSNDGPRAPELLVGGGSSWKYLDNGSDQGTAWRGTGFNDAGWSNGIAQFGYGDGDERTVIGYGSNPANKYITTYFRKQFVAQDASQIQGLTVKLVVDDGAAVYLNGAPAVSVNLSTNPAYYTRAAEMPFALESTWHGYSVDPSLLVSGTNLVAVELHQSAVTNARLSFDLQLAANRVVSAYLKAERVAKGIMLSWPTNATGFELQAAASPNAPNGWTNVPSIPAVVGAQFVVTNAATGARFYRLKRGT